VPAGNRGREAVVAELLAIETSGLRKQYDGIEAVRGLNLQVPAGSICGFLGRNGAGKTTTIKMLLGMTRPTAGQGRVFGLPIDDPAASVAIRRRSGFVSDEKDLYDSMDAAGLIRLTARLFPRWRADLEQQYVRRFEIPLTARVKTLSRGSRTKLALLLALCRGADLLILDEPTSGLDPAVTEQVLQALVAHVATAGATVFFSSHQIAEVEQIADRVAIIEKGRTALDGALDDLREGYRRIQFVFEGTAPAADDLLAAPGIRRVRRSGRVLSVLTSGGADAIVDRSRALSPVSVEVVPVTLKELFLETVAAEDSDA
jgi:ABC-type multidrug transport system ATPase subunit